MRTVRYTVSIEIALPREKVVQLLADPAHLPEWLRGLVLHEPLSGQHGQVGTTSRVVMQMGQRKIECTETSHAGNRQTCARSRKRASFTSTAKSSERACGAPCATA